MRKDLSVEYTNVHLVRCKPENTIGWRSMNKTPSRPVGTEKDVKYEARPKGSKHSLRCDQTRTD